MKPAGDALAIVNASRALLTANDPVGADRLLAPVIGQLRTDPSALHLMGMIKKAQGQWDGAERYLRSAVAHALSDGRYYNDLGVVLQTRGALSEAIRVFRAAKALMENNAGVRVNLVRCLIGAGEFADAEEEARAFIVASPGAEAWTLLSQVQRAQEQNDQALASAEAALECAPNSRSVQLSYASALERAGRQREALAQYELLVAQKLDSPELALALARALYAEGDTSRAETVLEQAAKAWPSAHIHAALARMRLLRGEEQASTALLEEALLQRPADLMLRLGGADVLHRGGHNAKALDILGAGLRVMPDAPPLLTAAAVLLDELDRTEDALRMLRRVVELTQGERSAQRNLLMALLRSRKAGEALQLARALRADDPHEQYLMAVEHTAMRALGQGEYRQMCDYARFVRSYELTPPRGYFTIENFNAALADTLRRQHRVNAHPLDQAVHRCSQTQRSLLTINDPHLRSFLRMVEEAIGDYISRLSAEDVLGARRTERYRIAGLWSTRIADGGHQPNHVHDRGWISAAYYVALLPQERPANPQSGWLKFGEPNRPLPNCGPEAMQEPNEGRLVLYPSYMWHGVVPFEGSERLSLSFDVIPG